MFGVATILAATLVASVSAICYNNNGIATGVTLDEDVCSSSYFTTGANSVVNGNIVAAAAVTLGDPTVVRGSITAGAAFTSDGGGSVYGDIHDGADFTSGANFVIYGCVYSTGAYTSGANSVVYGCVYAGGACTLGANSYVAGTVISGTNTITYGSGAAFGTSVCSCTCSSVFHTTEPTSTPEVVYSAQYSNTSSTGTCVINTVAQPLLAPSRNIYDLVVDVSVIGGGFYDVEGVTIDAGTYLAFNFNFVANGATSWSNLFLDWKIYDVYNEGLDCGDRETAIGLYDEAQFVSANCNTNCPYTTGCAIGTFGVNITGPDLATITPASRIVFTFYDSGYTSGRNHYGLYGFSVFDQSTSNYVHIPLVSSTNLTAPCFVALGVDVFNTDNCISESNSPSHNSVSHHSRSASHESRSRSESHNSHSGSKSHRSRSASHHSRSHSKSHNSHSGSKSHRSRSASHHSRSHSESHNSHSHSKSHHSHGVHSHSHSRTLSFSPDIERRFPNQAGGFTTNANCTSPFKKLQFNISESLLPQEMDFIYDEVAHIYLYLFDEYVGSQAGTNNCTLDRIWQPLNITGVASPLYIDIFETGPNTHSILGVTTNSPNFTFVITYAGPIAGGSPACEYPFVYPADLAALESCPEWIKMYVSFYINQGPYVLELDGMGSLSPTCDAIQVGNPELFASQIFGYDVMDCSVLNITITSNASHTCDAGCTSRDPITGKISYECVILNLQCTAGFGNSVQNPSPHTFAVLALFNNDTIPPYFEETDKISVVGFSIFNGTSFVDVDLVHAASPNVTCNATFLLDTANLTLPYCCSDDYLEEMFPYHEDSVVLNRGPIEPKCAFTRQIKSTNPVFAPFVGFSVPIPKGKFLFNIEIDFFAYFTPQHVNHYLAFLNQTGDYYSNGYNHLPYLEVPKVFYSMNCEDQLPACYPAELRRHGGGRNPNQPPSTSDEYTDCLLNGHTQSNYSQPWFGDACPILNQTYLTEGGPYVVLDGMSDTVVGGQAAVFSGVVEADFVSGDNPIFPWPLDGVLFTVAWSDFFPNDTIIIEELSYTICTVNNTDVYDDCETFIFDSMHCNSLPIGPADCECPDCTDTANSDEDDASFRWVMSPLLVDNGGHVAHGGFDSIGRRRVGPPSTSIIHGDIVDEDLTLFVQASQDIFPFTYPVNKTAYDVMSENQCGVFVSVDTCSHNLQVWLSPTLDDFMPLAPATFTSFSCHVLTSAMTQPPFPLSDNVYVTDPTKWTFLPATGGPTPPVQKLVEIDIISDTIWDDNGDGTLRFDQAAYGFEIPITLESPLEGIYFYCDVNIDVTSFGIGRRSLDTYNPLFAGKNVCIGSIANAINMSGMFFNPVYPTLVVHPVAGFVPEDTTKKSHFHYTASPQCPSYSLCPQDGWFINQDYAIDTDYIGLKLQFPSIDLIPDNESGVLPYYADITFKMNQTEVIEIVERYNQSAGDILIFALIMEGPFEPQNFLDFDIYFGDGQCASHLFPECEWIETSSFGTPAPNGGAWGANPYVRRVLGQGVSLDGFSFNALSPLDPLLFGLSLFGECLDAIFAGGYDLTDLTLSVNVAVDQTTMNTWVLNHLADSDYSNAYGSQEALAYDGLSRRFYFYGGALILSTLEDQRTYEVYGDQYVPSKDNYVFYRPSYTCQRQPFTVLNYCEGPCTELFQLDELSLADNITAKAECHPNSTVYDDLIMNGTAINEFLLGIDFSSGFGPYPGGIGEHCTVYGCDDYSGLFQNDTDRRYAVCDYHTTLIAHDIAVNGTGYAAKLKIVNSDEGDGFQNIFNVSHLGVFVTFKTDVLVDVLNDLAISLAPPFFPGVFVDYDNITREVHVFGTAVGLVAKLRYNDNGEAEPLQFDNYRLANWIPYGNFTNPVLVIVFFDMIVPNVTRDYINNDADFISHARSFKPGPYFKNGTNSESILDYERDQPATVKLYSACHLPFHTLDPVRDSLNNIGDFAFDLKEFEDYSESRDIVNLLQVDVPYEDLLGADPDITFRMGNGIADEGMLGALPIVASAYSLGLTRFGYMPAIFAYENEVINGTYGSQRFRFALYPCFTDCPKNATHRLGNHPGFAAFDYVSQIRDPRVITANNDSGIIDFSSLGPFSPGLVNPDNDNMFGGIAYGIHIVGDHRRRTSIDTAGDFLVVLNLDRDTIIQTLDIADGWSINVQNDIYGPLGITEADLGLYMNLRNTLGALNLFGVVSGVLFYLDGTNIYRPEAILVVTIGDYPGDPNVNFYPIRRYADDNDLFLEVRDDCAGTDYAFGTCLITGQLNTFFINTVGTPVVPLSTVLNYLPQNFAFSDLEGDFFNVGDLLNGTGYDGVDRHVVSGWGKFTPTVHATQDPLPDRRRGGDPGHRGGFFGGFKFVCADCWTVFDDDIYFNWGNSCDNFDICGILRRYEEPLTEITCIAPNRDDPDEGMALSLIDDSLIRTHIAFTWHDQFLTPSVSVLISISMVLTGPNNCDLMGTLNGVAFPPLTLVVGTPRVIATMGPFDGDNLPVDLFFNQTGCGPIIFKVQLNYTHPIDCREQTTSNSHSQSLTPKPSPSFSPLRDYCCERTFPMETYAPPFESTQSQPQTQSTGIILKRRVEPAAAGSRRQHHAIPNGAKAKQQQQRRGIPGPTQSPSIPPPNCGGRRYFTPSCPADDDCVCCNRDGEECRAQLLDMVSYPDCDCSGCCHYETNTQSESESPSPSISPSYATETIYVCDPAESPKMIMPGVTYQVRDEFVPFGSPFGPLYERMGLRVGALYLTFVDDGASVHLQYTPGQDQVTLYGWGYGRWSVPPNRVTMDSFNFTFRDTLYYFELNYTVGLIHTGGLTREPFGPGGVPFVAQEIPTPPTYVRLNKGYIEDVSHKTFSSALYAADIPLDIYVPELNPLITSFDPVEFMILSGLDTGLGANGWFGIGSIVADNCNDADTGPLGDEDYEHEQEDVFSDLLCYYAPELDTSAGFFMFVIEDECDDNCPHSQTPGVWCPIHNKMHSYSHSQSQSQSGTHSITGSQSNSDSNSETGRERRRHEHEGGDDEDFPIWAVIVIGVGGPLFVLLVIVCFIVAVLVRRNRQQQQQQQGGATQPLLEESVPTADRARRPKQQVQEQQPQPQPQRHTSPGPISRIKTPPPGDSAIMTADMFHREQKEKSERGKKKQF